MLGWALFVPVGFVLDPVFDRIGSSLPRSTTWPATARPSVRGCASRVSNASVDLGALQVADPFDPRKNLIEADGILLKLNPEALVE